MMPTKGLTLPLVSYGGSSLIIMMVAVSMLIRIDFELRQASAQARAGGLVSKTLLVMAGGTGAMCSRLGRG